MFRYETLKEAFDKNIDINLTIQDKLMLIKKIELELGFEEFEYSEDPKYKEYQVTKRLRCLQNLRTMHEGFKQKREYYGISQPPKKKRFWKKIKKKMSLSRSASSDLKDQIEYDPY